MQAILCPKYGLPDVLVLKEIETPVPNDDQVLIKTYTASVNSWDWDILTGTPYLYRLLFGLRKPKPQYQILGADVAGRVESVGKNVTRFQPGDVVFGDVSSCGWGGFAGYVCAAETAITHKPVSIPFEQAAAIPQAGVLALQALSDDGRLQPGDKVLINGAGGGVGTFAIQIAKAHGAEVTAVDSAEKLDLLRSLGADHVIDYRKTDFTQNGLQYNRIIDVVARHSIFAYQRSLLPNGVFWMVGGKIPSILQTGLLGGLLTAENKKLGLLVHEPNKGLAELTRLIESGKIRPMIDRVFPLAQTVEALQHLGDGRAKGKIIITMQHAN